MTIPALLKGLIAALLVLTSQDTMPLNKSHRNGATLKKISFINNLLYQCKSLNTTGAKEYAEVNTPNPSFSGEAETRLTIRPPPLPPPRQHYFTVPAVESMYIEMVDEPPPIWQHVSTPEIRVQQSIPPNILETTVVFKDWHISRPSQVNGTATHSPWDVQGTYPSTNLRRHNPWNATAGPTTQTLPSMTQVLDYILHIDESAGKAFRMPRPRATSTSMHEIHAVKQSWSGKFDWMQAARDYQACGAYTVPDTCRYSGLNSYRCTMPLGISMGPLIRTMKLYRIPFNLVLIDRGPIGLHLDLVLNKWDLPQLIDLFTMEDLNIIVSNLEQEERAIYESFRLELTNLPNSTFTMTTKAVLGKFVKRICSQDIFESGELYTTAMRSPDDEEETQPLVAFLHNLQGLAENMALSGTGKMDKPITATGPRRVRCETANSENYDQLQLRPTSRTSPHKVRKTSIGMHTTPERHPLTPPLYARPSPNYWNSMLNKSMPNPFQKDWI